MEYIIGILLFCIGIQRASIYISVIPATIALSGVKCFNFKFKELTLGSKAVWIPLLGIVFFTLISHSTWENKMFMLLLPVMYIVGLNSKRDIFKYMDWLVIVAVTSVIVTCAMAGGDKTGGLFSPENYNIITGIITLGTVVSRRWLMYPIAITGLIFTGSSEALIAIVGLLGIMMINKQYRILVCCAIILGLIFAVVTPLGITYKLWGEAGSYIHGVITNNYAAFSAVPHDRMNPYKQAVRSISLLGHGYEPFNVEYTTIHNVPLRIMYEIGIFGSLMWLWLLVWGLLKSKMKRVWVLIAMLSVFDHFLWTQLALWYWVLCGYTQTDKLELQGGKISV